MTRRRTDKSTPSRVTRPKSTRLSHFKKTGLKARNESLGYKVRCSSGMRSNQPFVGTTCQMRNPSRRNGTVPRPPPSPCGFAARHHYQPSSHGRWARTRAFFEWPVARIPAHRPCKPYVHVPMLRTKARRISTLSPLTRRSASNCSAQEDQSRIIPSERFEALDLNRLSTKISSVSNSKNFFTC
jgi:hypothetical protein